MRNSKFSVLKTTGIVVFVVIGFIGVLSLFGILKLETVTSSASGNNLTVCKSKRLVIDIGNFKPLIGNEISMGCVY